MGILDRYKIVHRTKDGKVVQVHEVYEQHVPGKLMEELKSYPADSFTVTRLET